jgi:hypothetical protein
VWLTQGDAKQVLGFEFSRPVAALAELSQSYFEFYCYCSKANPL